MVQDKTGFLWFGTQYGLNRYDGYRSKVFKHEPTQANSLSCVYIRSLFVDHSGGLWVGCDRFLDKFEPTTETFTHYAISTQVPGDLPTPIERISEDRADILWLTTEKGLYKFDPATRQATQYTHSATDPTSISGYRINNVGEDRSGRFWVASNGGLDQFDRKTGKVIWHVPFSEEISEFHEDKFGVFWMIASSNTPTCPLAAFDAERNLITCHEIVDPSAAGKSRVNVSGIVESADGTIWVSSSAGLIKVDRDRRQFTNYHNRPSDDESIESNDIIFLYRDKEGDIWTCFQETEPNFFSEEPQVFENFTYKRGSLVNPLVTAIYEDHHNTLWIASMGGMNRIDRRTGENTIPAGSGVSNEILAILEDRSGVLFCGMFHHALQRINPETGALSPYVDKLSTQPIMRLLFDRNGTLWAATYGGVSRLDRATGKFVTYSPEKQNAIQYQEIKEDRNGFLWLGAQSGLHRFDPQTGQFTIYQHKLDDPRSLSDNRVNSVHFDPLGGLWIGTQNGLDKFDPSTRTFKTFYERDGLAGNVVSCILEDKRGRLWMSTNNGLSSFDPKLARFRNFSAADGLPGPDLTGWGACYQSPRGEMFFGGFNGATAFYPDRIVSGSFTPKTVLTGFKLSGNVVPIGSNSVLRKSITYADSVTLSHQQSIFSIEFSGLSYFNPDANHYRYKLENLQQEWVEVNSDNRTASYTTLPTGDYTFRVQSATSRGSWDEPGTALRISILPPWWGTWWFRTVAMLSGGGLLWGLYRMRVRQMTAEIGLRYSERMAERTRLARDLHDTLLQSFQGLLLEFQAARNLFMRRPDDAMRSLDNAISSAEAAITEGRNAIQDLRPGPEAASGLADLLTGVGQELSSAQSSDANRAAFYLTVEGSVQTLSPALQDEMYRIGREILRNAFRHARATRIEVEIRYDERVLRLRIRDDGIGIDPKVLAEGARARHWGLPGVRERAKLIGAQLDFWSEAGAGTEVQIKVPAAAAYLRSREARMLRLFRKTTGSHGD